MSDPLLIPATPALLEGWAGPVVIMDHAGWAEVPLVGLHARVADGLSHGFVVGLTHDQARWPVCRYSVELEHIRLDLRRAEVRDRCARVECCALEAGDV